MLTSQGHEVVGILPFPLTRRARERAEVSRTAVGADVCVLDPGGADLDELRHGLQALEGLTAVARSGRNQSDVNTHRYSPEHSEFGGTEAAAGHLPSSAEDPCRFVVLTAEEHRSADGLRSLLEAQIRGVISKRRSAAEIIDALTVVHRGGIYFDSDLVRRALIAEAEAARTRPYSPPNAAGQLTQRELEVLRWLAHGAATGEMAVEMGISTATVRSHIKAAMSKLGVSSRLQAAARAVNLGLVEPPLGC